MKKLVTLLLLLSLLPASRVPAQVRVHSVRCENLINPVGLDVARPRFSWQLSALKKRRGVRQTAYELRVAASIAELTQAKTAVWQSVRGCMTRRRS